MTAVQDQPGRDGARWARADGYVGGVRTRPERWAAVTNPADVAETVGEYAVSSGRDVDAAVRAAHDAFPEWRALGARRRAELMADAAGELEKLAADLAPVISLEVGKVVAESRVDASGAVGLLRAFAALSDLAERELDVSDDEASRPATSARIRRVPVGPVAVIPPWNTPVYLTFNMLAPALISGCTVVVKPPEVAPLAVSAMLRRCAELLPPGVLNVVPGTGDEAGEALTRHELVRGILFTGGVASGRRVLEAAASTVKKVSLELGGNDPAIVLESATVDDELLRELVAGTFSSSGQICYNVKRVYVHRSRYDELVDGLAQMLGGLVVGDPFDPDVHMGPLTTRAGYDRAHRLLADAEREGARVLHRGVRAGSAKWADGLYVYPVLVTGVPSYAELVVEEQFAPVLPILPFDTDDEAVAEANRTEYGLGSSVWSDDVGHAETVAERVEAGNTFINVHRVGASVASVPFGGVKRSGLGRNHREYSLASCTEEHAIVHIEQPHSRLPGITRWENLSTGGPDR
ncbi:aldehyde dehydrogenase family protein [Phytoactinopolyspora endophytica]|uniref:aldehyde dehydrogenase family protein n=1 Tax=Phytoactinopolyspora endophytica TaxID=1642495 RepID=UPI00101CEDFA|nr:aldehyde dehydrogenase family protein [Phytoactinopolyspora endophytica]